jgi:hypothetical protein
MAKATDSSPRPWPPMRSMDPARAVRFPALIACTSSKPGSPLAGLAAARPMSRAGALPHLVIGADHRLVFAVTSCRTSGAIR